MPLILHDPGRALAHLRRVTASRAAEPILRTVLIESLGHGARITATDMDVWLSRKVDAEGAIPRCAVRLDLLLKVARGADSVTIKRVGLGNARRIELSTPDGLRVEARDLYDPDDFPTPPDAEPESGARLAISPQALGDAIRRTAPAISTEETRYYLNGIHLHADDDGRMVAVATDGHRLSRWAADADWPFAKTILPHKAAAAIERQLPRHGNAPITVRVRDDGAAASFADADWRLVAKMIDGAFPDYARVIPKPARENAFSATVSREQVRRIRDLADDFMPHAHIDPGAAKMTVRAGETRASLPISARGARITINARYLADFARLEPALRIEQGAADAALRITGESPEWIGLIMPIKPRD